MRRILNCCCEEDVDCTETDTKLLLGEDVDCNETDTELLLWRGC